GVGDPVRWVSRSSVRRSGVAKVYSSKCEGRDRTWLVSERLPDDLLRIAREFSGPQHRRRLLLAQHSANRPRLLEEPDRQEAECEERLRQMGRTLSEVQELDASGN